MTADRQRVDALILAAARRGVEDAVARMGGRSHKCLVEIDGEAMLERVVAALDGSGAIGRILVSIEREELLRATPRLAGWLDAGRIEFFESCPTLADSVLAVAGRAPECLPLTITTGDNVLHTPELVRAFVERFLAGSSDVAIGFTRQETVESGCPEVRLNWHRLKDGGWSACNLYGLRNARALETAEIFRGGGQFGKRHMRILKAFGILPFILYKLKAATLAGLAERTGRNLDTSVDIVELPWFFGPIDVDNPEFFRIAEDILRRRREGDDGR